MSRYPPSVTIAGYLLQAGIYQASKMHRLALAGKIADTHKPFDQYTLERLLAHARSQGDGGVVGSTAQYETVTHWLENHGWIDIDAKLLAEAAERRKILDEQQAANTGSSIQKVTADNPYGWAKPELMKREDHDVPGAWNPYRQCYNLTAKERLETKNPDYRYRGCSRFEVMPKDRQDAVRGWRPGSAMDVHEPTWKPKLGYDALEVARAQSEDYGIPTTVADQKVYGEQP
jgi:hypothetical protein